MWTKVKEMLSYIFPVPARTFHLKLLRMGEQQHQDMQEIKHTLGEYAKLLAIGEQQHQDMQEIKHTLGEYAKLFAMGEQQHQDMREIKYTLEKSTVDTQNKVNHVQSTADEILWANIFNSTIHENDWLATKNLSPGRWAVGYPFLYLLYRILKDTKPTRILELGLGETTRIISQYASGHRDVEHFVVEHDPEWITFFNNTFNVSGNTKIVQLPLAYQPYKESESVRKYEGFSDYFSNGKYDLICIDGPQGGDAEYARIDTLSLLPAHLSDSFAILVDDYERIPEQKMVRELLTNLEEAGIEYARNVYRGTKYVHIVCSNNLKFLTSL